MKHWNMVMTDGEVLARARLSWLDRIRFWLCLGLIRFEVYKWDTQTWSMMLINMKTVTVMNELMGDEIIEMQMKELEMRSKKQSAIEQFEKSPLGRLFGAPGNPFWNDGRKEEDNG